MYAELVKTDAKERKEEEDHKRLEVLRSSLRNKLVIFCENNNELIEFYAGLEKKTEFIKQVKRRIQEIRSAHLTLAMMEEF